MSSTTSGQTLFTIDVDEIIESARDKVGGEWQSGVDSLKARRTLNLVLIQLANKGIPLNKLATVTQNLTYNVQSYTFDNSIQDILHVTVSVPNTNPQAFLPIQRYSIEQFNAIPNQGNKNRPNTYSTQRLNNTTILNVWPIPDNLGTYQVRMVVAKRIQDVNASYQQIDLNTRYLPLLIQWLAYELSQTKQGIDEEIKARLKADLDSILIDTFDEDEERVDFTVKPGHISGR